MVRLGMKKAAFNIKNQGVYRVYTSNRRSKMEVPIHKSHLRNKKVLHLILRLKHLELEAMKLQANFFAVNLNAFKNPYRQAQGVLSRAESRGKSFTNKGRVPR